MNNNGVSKGERFEIHEEWPCDRQRRERGHNTCSEFILGLSHVEWRKRTREQKDSTSHTKTSDFNRGRITVRDEGGSARYGRPFQFSHNPLPKTLPGNWRPLPGATCYRDQNGGGERGGWHLEREDRQTWEDRSTGLEMPGHPTCIQQHRSQRNQHTFQHGKLGRNTSPNGREEGADQGFQRIVKGEREERRTTSAAATIRGLVDRVDKQIKHGQSKSRLSTLEKRSPRSEKGTRPEPVRARTPQSSPATAL